MRNMKWLRKSSLWLLVLLVAYSCQSGKAVNGLCADCTAAHAQAIRQAGDQLQVPVRTDRMAELAQAGATSFAAPAANLEGIPATELPRGVNIGVVYLDLPGQKFAKGFYKLRAFADVKQIGRINGRAQLIGATGDIVAELPAVVDVRSLTVPETAKSRLTTVALCTGVACNLPGSGSPAALGYWLCTSCPNGYIVCVRAFGDPFFD